MKTRHAIFLLLLAASLPPLLAGCGRGALDPQDEEQVCVPLALSVGRVSSPGTKMQGSVTQTAGNAAAFRGIERIYAIPFSTPYHHRDRVIASDVRYGANLLLPHTGIANTFGDDAQGGSLTGLVSNNNAHLYGNVFIRRGTSAVLVYGQAAAASVPEGEGTVPFKRRNGVILPTNLDILTATGTAGEISFDLESFLQDEATGTAFAAWKAANLSLLNHVAAATSGTCVFGFPSTYSSHAGMTALLNAFTGGGGVFSGADEVISRKLTDLYNGCYTLTVSPGVPAAVQALATAVRTVIEGETELLTITGSEAAAQVATRSAAPGSFGLPAGTVTLRWRAESGTFHSPDKADGVNVASVSTYCYPPALWYFSNSPLLTSLSRATVNTAYTSSRAWDDITALYNGQVVMRDTEAAAVRDALQYAVALLKVNVNIKEGTSTLMDSADNPIAIDNLQFPLTGIIVGGQRVQGFDFTPAGTGSMRFLYDGDVYDGEAPQAWLTSFSTAAVRTIPVLTFETGEQEDVNFALEFLNGSTSTIHGYQGCTIVPGSKFYLLGSMEWAQGTIAAGATAKQGSVLVKDHVTTLNVSFSGQSLTLCYDILPELTSPDLQMGVSAKLNWELSTPVTVPVK